ncbi:MAG: hypothetical protein HY903_24785 [Deltaproteobacteria bacterium]|nr:hypothetical protein [Deltaproteobacteria bacterium]
MLAWLLSTVALVAATPPASIAVVALGPAPLPDAATYDRARQQVGADHALSTADLWERLTGNAAPHDPDLDSVQKMFAEARDCEARYDTAGANALRLQIVRVFDRAAHLSPTLIATTANAMLDLVANLHGDEQRREAERQAAEIVRRFGALQIDPIRYAPGMRELLGQALARSRREAERPVHIEVDTAGEVFAEGRSLGAVITRLTTTLPSGRTRVWLLDHNGRASLPYLVEAGDHGATVKIQTALDLALSLEPIVALRCPADCAEPLRALGVRLRVDRIVGVRAGDDGPTGIAVEVQSGVASPWSLGSAATTPEAATTPSTALRPKFRPLYLLPFGGGQFAGYRPIAGGVVAGVDLGLLAWHVLAWRAHRDALARRDFGQEPALRSRRNLSAGLFYGALALGVVEAVVVGAITGE